MQHDDPGVDFWALVARRVGAVSSVRFADRGYSADVTATVWGERSTAFVKAARDPGPQVVSMEREAAINPHVRSVSPALRWMVREGGWIVLGFDVVAGTHADFTPESTDLPEVVATVAAIGAIGCPTVAEDWRETRWHRFTDRPDLFVGDTLLYTDINPDNMLMQADGRASVVDWAWPTRGAAFIDPGCLVVQFLAAGHTPEQAEGWAARCPAWREADPVAVDAFAGATVRMYRHFAELDPAPWRNAMTEAVVAWATYRGLAV